jgi:hypothetical protein
MPLNHTDGEQIEGFDPVYRVVPVAKWAEQTRMTTVVKRMSTGKFKRLVDKKVPIYTAAVDYAREAFYNAGAAPGSLGFDMICQEHFRVGMVIFVFNATINGVEHYVTAPFSLGHEQIADLTVRNLWQSYTVN